MPRSRARSATPERSGSEEPEPEPEEHDEEPEDHEDNVDDDDDIPPPVKERIEHDGPETWDDVAAEEEDFEVPAFEEALVLDDAEDKIEMDESTDPLTGRPISQLLAEAKEDEENEEDEDAAPARKSKWSTTLQPNLSLTSENFDPVEYICTVHAKTSFADLQEGVERLRRIVADQAQQLKTLLKQHFHNYVACKEAVENMQRELTELEDPRNNVHGSSDSLQQAFNVVYKRACEIYDPIIQRKQFSDDARTALQLLRRINFALSLPGQLDEQFSNGEYEGVVRTYQRAKSMLQDSKVPLLQKVLEEVQKKADRVQQVFLDKMGDSSTTEEEALRLAGCVKDLSPKGEILGLILQQKVAVATAALKALVSSRERLVEDATKILCTHVTSIPVVADAVSGRKSMSKSSSAEIKQQVNSAITAVFAEYSSLVSKAVGDNVDREMALAVQRAAGLVMEGDAAKLLGKRIDEYAGSVIQQFAQDVWASCKNDVVQLGARASEGQLVEGFASAIQSAVERCRGLNVNEAIASVILKAFQAVSLAFLDALHPQLATSAAFQVASATSRLASSDLKAQWDKLARCLSKEIVAKETACFEVCQEACAHLHQLAVESIGRQLCKAITSKCHEGLRVPASSMTEDIRGFLVQILLGFVELRTKLEESFGAVIRLGMRHLLNTYAEIAYECERDSDLAESLNFEFRFLLAISMRDEGRTSRSSNSGESSQNWKHVMEKLKTSHSLSEDALKTCIQKHRIVLEALDMKGS